MLCRHFSHLARKFLLWLIDLTPNLHKCITAIWPVSNYTAGWMVTEARVSEQLAQHSRYLIIHRPGIEPAITSPTPWPLHHQATACMSILSKIIRTNLAWKSNPRYILAACRKAVVLPVNRWVLCIQLLVHVCAVASWFQPRLMVVNWWAILTCRGLLGDRPKWTLEIRWSTTLTYELPVLTTVWQQPSSNSSFTTKYDQQSVFIRAF